MVTKREFRRFYWDVVGALIVNTIFGPVEVGGAVGNYGHGKFFFQIGRVL